MISIIITAREEGRTIGRAIEAILENKIIGKYELLIIAPDEKTLNIVSKYKKKYSFIRSIKDQGKGKPAALNLAVSNAKGNLLVLTDGDVYIGENSLTPLLKPFKDKKIGAVTGNPVSINPKNSMLGFWAYLLTEIANKRRLRALTSRRRFFCSGYLFAIRKNLFPKLPENLLSEDGFISHSVYEKKYKISYAPKAKVYVKYPTNFKDWIKQKKRSVGGYNQIKKLIRIEIRSFKQESFGGLELFKLISNFKELIWLLALFLARIYLWLVIYKDINIKKKSRKEMWLRVESTK